MARRRRFAEWIVWNCNRFNSFGVMKSNLFNIERSQVPDLKLCGFFVCSCSENTGLLGLTKVGSRRVVQISAGFMIFFSIFGNTPIM